ncbi:hypothetical protein [Romboutsia sp.]|uniref:hypothetical protein n=1 Tax=Romboutsia sp. TaxID=1965302 RepID=UPI003F2C1352
MFWNCSVNSVFNGNISWFDLTFGQYIILSVIFTYILSIAFSTMAMFVSSKVYTYIALIGAQIPILFLINKGISRPIEYFLLFTGTYVPKYTLPIVLIVLILTAVIFMITANKKECIRDINN